MVRDHIGEVAVMRALGCSRLPVAAVLIVEAMLIGLGGAAVGASLAITLFGHGFTLGALTGSLGYIAVSWPVAMYAVAIATIVGILGALLPVIDAARICRRRHSGKSFTLLSIFWYLAYLSGLARPPIMGGR